MPKKTVMDSAEKAQLLMDAIEDRKAMDPVCLDLRDKVNVADFFVICTGTSVPHIRALAENVLEQVDEANLAKPNIQGEAVGEWILMDFGDVVLHILNEESRQRYRLEEFWTTPQPKGALPPTPGSDNTGLEVDPAEWEDELEGDDDEETWDDEELDDAAFFADADAEVEPVDEESVEDA